MNILIGPHEGIEFELIDQGQKHVALFYEIIPELYYEYRDRPEFGSIEFEQTATIEGKEIPIPYVILFRKSHQAQAKRLEEILKADVRRWHAALERETGEILGYPTEVIDFFIARACKN